MRVTGGSGAGPTMNGISTTTGLPDTWDPAAEPGTNNLLWKRTDLGSRSTPIFMNGRLYMICSDKVDQPELEGERVVCLDAQTGDTVWERSWNIYLSDVPRERVGWASVTGDPRTGQVFALGVTGLFTCLDGQTGEPIWEHSLSEEFGLITSYGGRTNTPFIHETNAIISGVVVGWDETAKPTDRQLAFDTRNGELIWNTGTRTFPHLTNYSSPILTTFEGELAMVFGSGDGGYHALQPRTGKILWSYYISGSGIHYTPLIVGDRVFGGHAEENIDDRSMGALFCLDGTARRGITEPGDQTAVLWRTNELVAGRSSPLHIDGRLYAIDDRAKMHILNSETSEEIALQRMGTAMRASPLYADGKIYAGTFNGRGYVYQPSEDGVDVLHQLRFEPGEECHGSAIAAHGRIYFPTTDAMYCIADTEAEVAADLPVDVNLDLLYPFLDESAPDLDTTPAQALVVPAEAMLGPGDTQPFHVRLYNAGGQFLKVATPEEVSLSIDGPGDVAIEALDNGQPPLWTYSIPADHTGQAAVHVTATIGDIEGAARIRVVPELAWAYDFDDGNVPITWVGCQYRHIVIDYDLFTTLNEQNPLAGQLYIYLRTGFVNTGAPAQTFDDSTARIQWTELLRFLDLMNTEDTPTTAEQGETVLGPALQLLQDEGVIASSEWSSWDQPTGVEDETEPAPRLVVTRGERGVDGNGVLCKVKTIPKGSRSRGWMGNPALHDFTIQADVMGAVKNGKMPDIGLVGQRYTIDLMGASQQLQIRSWTAQLDRFSVSVPFEWEADTWYTLKFQTAVEDGAAVLRGKVWVRGEEEPADWMVVGEDAAPNVNGSPGLFGNAKDAELFYDNLSVTPNAGTGSAAEEPAG